MGIQYWKNYEFQREFNSLDHSRNGIETGRLTIAFDENDKAIEFIITEG